jgi:hypothetical protein
MSPEHDRRSVWSTAWADALRATSLGWDLAVPICGAALLGHYLKQRLQLGYEVTVGLLALGVLVGFYNVGRKLYREILLDRYLAALEAEEEATTWPESPGSPPAQG